LTTLTHDSRLNLTIAAWLSSTLYKSLRHTPILFSLLCLHQLFPGNTASNSGDSSTPPTKSFLHRLPYNSLLLQFVLVITSWNGRVENMVHYCTPIIFMGTCLFVKALLSNGCIHLLIKNLFPSRGCSFFVCFEVITQ
jgi:hypothetical protein